MKMFTIGVTSLPKGGMQAVANQLGDKATDLGVDIQLESRVISIKQGASDETYILEVESKDEGKYTVQARSIIVATDCEVAQSLLQDMSGMEQQIESTVKLDQRSVGCVYYAFQSPAPLSDPILVLNGEGADRRNTKEYPVNNVCFPSVVQRSYAPDGYELCSVSILETAMSEHGGDHASLDAAVRKQLSTWFPDYEKDIMDHTKWIKKGVYTINNAQPAHYGTEESANFHGGRSSKFRGVLPNGIFVCGDHMATSTFNGALESGVNAGESVSRYLYLNDDI